MKKKAPKELSYNWLYAILPLVATYITFLSLRQAEFLTWDDNVYVYENILIRNLNATGIKDIFRNFVMGNYHPLVILSYAVEYKFAGNNPQLYHTTNLILHLIATFFVFVISRKLSGKGTLAMVSALFFGLHPLHVESVAWVTERKDVLYGVFYLGAILSWIRFRDSGEIKFYFLTLFLFILSCLSKGQAVTLPLALGCIDLLRGKEWKKLIQDKLYLLSYIPALAFGALAIYAQRYGGNIRSSEAFSVLEQFVIGCWSLLFYIPKFLAPISLVPFYPYPHAPLPLLWYLSPCILIALIFAGIKYRRQYPVLFFGLAFYLIHLVPVAQFLPVGNAIAADRYFYIPALGLGYVLAWFLFEKLNSKYALTLGLGISLVWGILSREQIKIWKNTETFFSGIIQKDPKVDFAFINLGRYLEKQNRKREAVDVYLEGIRINPEYPDQYNDAGYTLSHLGKYDSSILLLRKALELSPGLAEAHNNLGYTFSMIQKYDSAEYHLKTSIELNPKNETAFNNLGSTYSMMGRLPEAIQMFTRAVTLKPDYADAWNNMGSNYGMQGNNAQALEYFQKAIQLKPDFGGAWFNYGIALQSMGNTFEAFEAYRKSARLNHAPAQEFLRSKNEKW